MEHNRSIKLDCVRKSNKFEHGTFPWVLLSNKSNIIEVNRSILLDFKPNKSDQTQITGSIHVNCLRENDTCSEHHPVNFKGSFSRTGNSILFCILFCNNSKKDVKTINNCKLSTWFPLVRERLWVNHGQPRVRLRSTGQNFSWIWFCSIMFVNQTESFDQNTSTLVCADLVFQLGEFLWTPTKRFILLRENQQLILNVKFG